MWLPIARSSVTNERCKSLDRLDIVGVNVEFGANDRRYAVEISTEIRYKTLN